MAGWDRTGLELSGGTRDGTLLRRRSSEVIWITVFSAPGPLSCRAGNTGRAVGDASPENLISAGGGKNGLKHPADPFALPFALEPRGEIANPAERVSAAQTKRMQRRERANSTAVQVTSSRSRRIARLIGSP